MVEWKVDPHDGRPRLLEINPRFWGSLELASRAGIDFPLLYGLAASGKRLPEASRYRVGARCRWIVPGEILRYLSDRRREPLREFLRGLPRLAEEWDSRDRRGAIATVICLFLQALRPRYWKYLRRG